MKSSSKTSAISAKTKRPTSRAREKHSGDGSIPARRRTEETGLVVGVDIGGSSLRVALADVAGNVLGKWTTSTRATSSPEMVIKQIEHGVDSLLQGQSATRRSLRAIAAGAPGVTDPKAGIVLATSYLRGWKNVRFRDLLESAFHVPAAIENDVRTAALGEHWMGAARGMDDFVFLALGTGIAAGIFANGKLIHGVHCTAGEVGYMYVPGASEEPAKPGAPGSLESIIGGGGIRQQWMDGCKEDGRAEGPSATEIFQRASGGEALSQKVLERSAQLLAYAIYNIALVMDSSLFVLGGGVGVSGALRDATERVLEKYNEPSSPKLVISRLGTDAQIMGAIRLALTTASARSEAQRRG